MDKVYGFLLSVKFQKATRFCKQGLVADNLVGRIICNRAVLLHRFFKIAFEFLLKRGGQFAGLFVYFILQNRVFDCAVSIIDQQALAAVGGDRCKIEQYMRVRSVRRALRLDLKRVYVKIRRIRFLEFYKEMLRSFGVDVNEFLFDGEAFVLYRLGHEPEQAYGGQYYRYRQQQYHPP